MYKNTLHQEQNSQLHIQQTEQMLQHYYIPEHSNIALHLCNYFPGALGNKTVQMEKLAKSTLDNSERINLYLPPSFAL